MVIYTICCSSCEETRIGREKNGDVEPYKDACPNCGEMSYTLPAKD
jgi:hypothetical protein